MRLTHVILTVGGGSALLRDMPGRESVCLTGFGYFVLYLVPLIRGECFPSCLFVGAVLFGLDVEVECVCVESPVSICCLCCSVSFVALYVDVGGCRRWHFVVFHTCLHRVLVGFDETTEKRGGDEIHPRSARGADREIDSLFAAS